MSRSSPICELFANVLPSLPIVLVQLVHDYLKGDVEFECDLDANILRVVSQFFALVKSQSRSRGLFMCFDKRSLNFSANDMKLGFGGSLFHRC